MNEVMRDKRRTIKQRKKQLGSHRERNDSLPVDGTDILTLTRDISKLFLDIQKLHWFQVSNVSDRQSNTPFANRPL